jgi:hypothetical protein
MLEVVRSTCLDTFRVRVEASETSVVVRHTLLGANRAGRAHRWLYYRVPSEELAAMQERLAAVLGGKLVKSLRRHLQQISRHLEARFITEFEEEGGVRRPWTSNLKQDADHARAECAHVLSRVPLVPSGLHVPCVGESELEVARVCPCLAQSAALASYSPAHPCFHVLASSCC